MVGRVFCHPKSHRYLPATVPSWSPTGARRVLGLPLRLSCYRQYLAAKNDVCTVCTTSRRLLICASSPLRVDSPPAWTGSVFEFARWHGGLNPRSERVWPRLFFHSNTTNRHKGCATVGQAGRLRLLLLLLLLLQLPLLLVSIQTGHRAVPRTHGHRRDLYLFRLPARGETLFLSSASFRLRAEHQVQRGDRRRRSRSLTLYTTSMT